MPPGPVSNLSHVNVFVSVAALEWERKCERYEAEAHGLIVELGEVRAYQVYCQRYGATPALDSVERELLRQLTKMRARFRLAVH